MKRREEGGEEEGLWWRYRHRVESHKSSLPYVLLRKIGLILPPNNSWALVRLNK